MTIMFSNGVEFFDNAYVCVALVDNNGQGRRINFLLKINYLTLLFECYQIKRYI